MQELQKEIQMRMPVSNPPIFVLAKQIGENCTLETIFFKVLEERGRVREILITELMSHKYQDQEWAKKLVEGLLSNELHLFMQVSHQASLAKEMIDKDLSTKVWLDTLVEQGPFNDYMFPKYF